MFIDLTLSGRTGRTRVTPSTYRLAGARGGGTPGVARARATADDSVRIARLSRTLRPILLRSHLVGHGFIEITTPSHADTPLVETRAFVVNDVDGVPRGTRRHGHRHAAVYVVRRDIERNRVDQLLPDLQVANQSVWLSYPELRRQSAKTRAFVDFLATTLAAPRTDP